MEIISAKDYVQMTAQTPVEHLFWNHSSLGGEGRKKSLKVAERED